MSTLEEIIEGLKIFNKYGADFGADHDIIYVGPTMKWDGTISKEDEEALDHLGWHLSSETNSWARFV